MNAVRVLCVAALCGLGVETTFADVTIPAASRAGDVPVTAGTGLSANIWQSYQGSIAASRAFATSNVAAGSFNAGTISYGDASISTPLSSWLGSDAASLSGIDSATGVSGMIMVFRGFVAVPTAGNYTFTVSSDDGMQLVIGGEVVTAYDGDRGFGGSSNIAQFAEAGLYPIDLLYWANTAGNSGLRLDLDQGNGSGVIPTALLYPIPAPGAAMLAGVAMVVGSRRRRG